VRKITTKKHFEAWLREQPEDVIFKPHSCNNCPLALYAKTYVGSVFYSFRNLCLPEWAARYAQRFDDAEIPGKDAALRALRSR
jgi:hypothetical protein